MIALDPVIRIRLILLLIISFFATSIFNSFMRRYLGVEKRKSFLYSPVNKKNKKINRIIAIVFAGITFLSFFYRTRSSNEVSWYLEYWFITVIFLICSQIVTIFMEWKYSKNRKDYLFSFSQLIFFLVFLGIIFISNFFIF